ncbi:hypothetical protein [Rhizobium halophytocola]|uniref:Uncharacterized protein n=1 Tax=Rhizobium halophytocola TaxID=735519 RepID=A0ABS4DWY6_9HYPH|nr:hypothetical protein [Rhizobium halophytocola]MBP1850209.1 hypothetical protein [Rhizobium halophytocola]
MDDLLYVGFILAGAATLVIEAYRNFNSVSARHPFELHPILKGVEVRNLCTSGEILFGFIWYAFFYLIAYAVILSSAEVYALVSNASTATKTIGAAGAEIGVDNPFIEGVISGASTDYSKPIIVSALIVSSLSLGAVRPIESTMRAIAHRFAGVPRGIYRVIENLQRKVDYARVMERHPNPLGGLFKAKISAIGQLNSNDESAHSKGRSKKDMPPSGATPVKWSIEKTQITEMLQAVDCLRQVTNPVSRNLYFPLYNLEQLRSLSEKLDDQYYRLKSTISDLDRKVEKSEGDFRPPEDALLEERLAELINEAMLMKSNLMAYFAVLFVRNNYALYSPDKRDQPKLDNNPVRAIRDAVFTAEKDERNSFVLGLIMASALSFLSIFLLYQQWDRWYVMDHPEVYEEIWHPIAESAQASPSGNTGGSGINDARLRREAEQQWLRQRSPELLAQSIWDQLLTLSITVSGVLFVMIARDIRREEQSWPEDWNFYQFPILRFLTTSILSGLSACFLAPLVKIAQIWWFANFDITNNQVIDLFRASGGQFALQFGAGLILGVSALTLMDRHKDSGWTRRRTVSFALGCGILYAVYQWCTLYLTLPLDVDSPSSAPFSRSVRDALILSALPAMFLVFFGWLLELSEKARPKYDMPPDKDTAEKRRMS